MASFFPSGRLSRRLLYEVLHLWASAHGHSAFNIGISPVDPRIKTDPRFGSEPHQVQLYAELAKFAGLLPPDAHAPARILEVGVGGGSGLAFLKSNVAGTRFVGIDNTRAAVRSARRKGLEAYVAPAEKLPFPNASFDYVLCVDSFSIFERQLFLAETFRTLTPEGALIIGDYLLANRENVRRALDHDAERADVIVERFFDATNGVLRALEEDHDRKVEIMRSVPGPLRSKLAETMSLRGSERYEQWQRGEACYYMAVLRKIRREN